MAVLLISISLVRDLKLNQLVVKSAHVTENNMFSFFTAEDATIGFIGDEFSETEEGEEEEKKEKEKDTEDDDLFFDEIQNNAFVLIPFKFKFNYHSLLSSLKRQNITPPPRTI